MSENREGVPDIESGVVHFRSRYRAYSVLSICLVGLTGTLLGYNTGVLMGAFSLFQDKLEIQIITGGLILSATTAVSPICSYLGYHIISSWLGNRYTLILTSVLYITLELIMGLGENIVVVFVAWLVLSLSMGYNLVPTYIEEVRPPKRKWVKAIFSDNSTKFGTIIGFVAYNIIHTRWWLMSIIAVIPALVIDVLVFYMPESPKWLVLKGRVKEAKSVLLMTSSDETEADSRLMNLYLEYPNSFTEEDLQNKNFQCLSAITHFKMTLREAVSKCRSTEEKVVQLENQLETCEKRYEDASREGLSWKRKYERVLSKDAASAEIAVLKSRTTAAQSRLAAARQQTQTARNEAEGWKKRYKRAVQEESQQERD